MASDTTSLPAQAPDIAVPAAPGAPAAPQKIARPRSGLAEFLEMLLVTMLLALFGTTFVVQAFKIPSGSMEPTLLIGDHVFVNKFIFEGTGAWYEKLLPYRDIRRGDIIVFKFPFDDHPHYVKRVIGLPGDRLRIVNGDVYIDGVLLQEPYVVHDPAARDPYADNFPPTDRRVLQFVARREWADQLFNNVRDGELIVPPNHYFAMGDNRDRSADSRYWGFVDRDSIMGRPMVIYWSVRATSDDYRSRGVSSVLSGMGQTLLHLRAQTRWDRMLREVH
ncbi:MAG: signal peptidase I [Candidatus Acidiferrales bacterium]